MMTQMMNLIRTLRFLLLVVFLVNRLGNRSHDLSMTASAFNRAVGLVITVFWGFRAAAEEGFSSGALRIKLQFCAIIYIGVVIDQ